MALFLVPQLLAVLFLAAMASAQVPTDPDEQMAYYMLNPGTSEETRDPGRRLDEDRPESIVFYFYSNSNQEGVILSHDGSNALEAGWDPLKTVKILIHGFTNNVTSDFSVTLRNSYLNFADFNVLVVDWGLLCQGPNYFRAVRNVQVAGEYVGDFILRLIGIDVTEYRFLHYIGHSLGAHVAGHAAARGLAVHRLSGLDPAGPLFSTFPFFFTSPGIVINSALIIDTIMTNAGRLGITDRLGRTNFLPNGGSSQPGCSDVWGSCSHRRAFEFFEESIFSRTTFPATLCDSYGNFLNGNCGQPNAGMGDAVSYRFEGDYYLTTNAFTPFNRG